MICIRNFMISAAFAITPLTAFASEAAVDTTELKQIIIKIAIEILTIASPFILALFGFLLKRLTDWISTKTKNEQLKGIITRLDDSLMKGVQYTTAIYVQKIKEAKSPDSPGGTSLTKEEQEEAMRTAIEATKIFMGQNASKELSFVFGVDTKKQEEAMKMRAEVILDLQKIEKNSMLSSISSEKE